MPFSSRLAGRLAAALFRLALALPWLLLAALLVPLLAGPSRAAEPACEGKSLMEELRTSGRLAAVEAQAAKIPNGTGRLFRIERAGIEPSFLFGTMHLTDPRVLTLPAPARTAFDAAGRLVIETTDVLDETKAAAALFARADLLTLPAGRTLSDLLDPEDEARVEAALAEKGIPFQSIQTLQPWFSGISLMLPACEAARKSAGEPVLDVALAREATAAGKPVEGLETSVEQLEAMASLPMQLQIDSLIATLDLGERMPDVVETMLQLYLGGRIAMITPVIEAAVPLDDAKAGSGKAYAEFEKRVVNARNHTMAARLQPILDKGDAFVAVGALHLPGEEGLVELLRAEGWTVTRADTAGPGN